MCLSEFDFNTRNIIHKKTLVHNMNKENKEEDFI